MRKVQCDLLSPWNSHILCLFRDHKSLFLGVVAKLHKVTVGSVVSVGLSVCRVCRSVRLSCLSVCRVCRSIRLSTWNSSVPTGGIVMKCSSSSSSSSSIGFGGLRVACWPLVPKFVGSNSAEAIRFLWRKNPQHAFLRRGSKTVGPMS